MIAMVVGLSYGFFARNGMGDGHKQFDWKSRRWSEENLREHGGSFNVRKAEP